MPIESLNEADGNPFASWFSDHNARTQHVIDYCELAGWSYMILERTYNSIGVTKVEATLNVNNLEWTVDEYQVR